MAQEPTQDDSTEPFTWQQHGRLGERGRYQLALPFTDASKLYPCIDLHMNRNLSCQIYPKHPTTQFLKLAPLLMASVEGVQQPIDMFNQDDYVAFLYPPSYGDLLGHLKSKKRLSEAHAASYFKQIINIVANAHHQGFILRDFNLKKFVFTDSSRKSIKLCNLQDAIVGSDLLEDRRCCPFYVAPEMLQPGPYSGRATDMWITGIILYTLIVGHYPFSDVNTSPQILFSKIRSGSYQIPENISLQAKSLITSLLTYNPALRPSTKAVLNHPWLVKPPNTVEILPLSKIQSDQDQVVPTHKLID